ncbi:MAG: DNA repair protein RadC [Clostridia bacterium]|nr:DNA repair protein RadC [Clostridia bacterium]
MAGLHDGHRERIDDKTKMLGFERLEEHEQLEKILFNVIPRGNTNPLAHQLIDQFGSLYGVLTAPVENLILVPGVGNRVAQYLHDLFPLLGSVERCMLVEAGKKYPVLDTIEKKGAYIKSLFYGKLTEQCFMVSLNRKNQAYRFDLASQGDAEETAMYTKEIIKLALRTDAASVIIAHNHPSGTLVPSQADIRCTKELVAGFNAVGITLDDHIIVGHGEYISLKKLGVI